MKKTKEGSAAYAPHRGMKDMPAGERPYEKFMLSGAGLMSQEELLAVILRSGTGRKRVTEVARAVLSKCEEYGGLSYLERVPVEELMSLEGIGRIKAIQLRCLGELSRRIALGAALGGRARIGSPEDVRDIFSPQLGGLEVEEAWALYLDGKNGVVRKSLITRGTVNGSMISGREVFKEAVRCSAAGLILVHNHPSADPEPSREDIQVTDMIREGAALLDIDFIDHVIIGGRSFVSMRERGIL